MTGRRGPGVFATGRALVGAEARVTVRDTAGLLVPFILPLVVMVASAVQPSAGQVVGQSGQRVLEVFTVPSVTAMVCALIAIVNMPSFLATYRRTGVLRTLAVTPVRPAALLVAQLLVSLIQLLIGVAMMLAAAVAVFGLQPPVRPDAALLGFALGVLGLYGVGLLVASLAPSPNAAVACGLMLFLGVGALGGMFGPTTGFPEPLRILGEHLPFGALVASLQAAWSGASIPVGSLVALAAAGVLGAVVAVFRFRWH